MYFYKTRIIADIQESAAHLRTWEKVIYYFFISLALSAMPVIPIYGLYWLFSNKLVKQFDQIDQKNSQLEIQTLYFTVSAYSDENNSLEGGKYLAISSNTKKIPVVKGAVAADLKYWSYGTIFYIKNYGYGVVADKGKRVKGKNRLDIAFPGYKSKELEKKWGWQERHPVYLHYQPTNKAADLYLLQKLGPEKYIEEKIISNFQIVSNI